MGRRDGGRAAVGVAVGAGEHADTAPCLCRCVGTRRKRTQQRLDGGLQLAVPMGGDVFGRVLYLNIRRNAQVLHILAVGGVVAPGGQAEARAVYQAGLIRADDVARRRHAYDLAQVQGAEPGGEDLGVAVGMLIDQQHNRLGEGAFRLALALAVARLDVGVDAPRERFEHSIVRVAAGIAANVEEEAVLVYRLAVKLPLEPPGRVRIHRFEMDIGQTIAGELIYQLSVVPHARLILQLEPPGHRNGLDLDGARPVFGRLAVDQQFDGLVGLVLKPLVVVLGRLHVGSVYAQNVLAGLDARGGLVRRAFGQDAAHFQTRPGIVLIVEQAERGRLRAAALARGRDLGMRRIDLADHLGEQVSELLRRAHALQQRRVLVVQRLPVDAVHRRVVEAGAVAAVEL